MRQTTIQQTQGEDRMSLHTRQIEAARKSAREVGGKFVSQRGNDCFGHPVVSVIDADGAVVEEIRQSA